MASKRVGVLDHTWRQVQESNLRNERIYYRNFGENSNRDILDTLKSDSKRTRQSPRLSNTDMPYRTKTSGVSTVNGYNSYSRRNKSNTGKSDTLASSNSRNSGKSDTLPNRNRRQNSDKRVERPKSARPETRQGRPAHTDMETDEVARETSTISRPKSARPESRMERISGVNGHADRLVLGDGDDYSEDFYSDSDTNSEYDLDSNSDLDLNFEISSSGNGQERPKSRKGFRITPISPDQTYADQTATMNISVVGTGGQKPSKGILKKSENQNQKSVATNRHRLPEKRDKDGQMAGALESSGNEQHRPSVEDLNTGMSDIDLSSLDPVLYFNHGENYVTKSRTIARAPTLSKEVISVIGKTKSPLKTKPPIGYHGNNQNRSKASTENESGFHRNRSYSLQTDNSDAYRVDNQMKRRNRIKSDSSYTGNINTYITPRTGGRDNHHAAQTNTGLKRSNLYRGTVQSSRHDCMTSQNQNHSSFDDTARHGYGFGEHYNQHDQTEEFRMKQPRKLTPLTGPSLPLKY